MSRIAAFFETVRKQWHHHREPMAVRRELLKLRPAAQGRASQDFEVPMTQFATTAGNADSDLRIDRVMQVLHIDRRELQNHYSKVLGQAELICFRCKSKRRCLRELEAGTLVANMERFCPNADLFAIFADGPDIGAGTSSGARTLNR